jgi:hypothetical protein
LLPKAATVPAASNVAAIAAIATSKVVVLWFLLIINHNPYNDINISVF